MACKTVLYFDTVNPRSIVQYLKPRLLSGLFSLTNASSVRLGPTNASSVRSGPTKAPSIRLLPLQYDYCLFNTTIATSIRLLPLQYDCCQIRPISSHYDLRPSYTTILSLIPLHISGYCGGYLANHRTRICDIGYSLIRWLYFDCQRSEMVVNTSEASFQLTFSIFITEGAMALYYL